MNKPLSAAHVAQTRRLGVLAAHSIDEFVFSVPDLDVAEEFYTLFGLNVVRAEDQLEIYAFGNPHRFGRIIKGPKKRLQWITFGVYPEDFEPFKAHLKTLGIATIDSPDPKGDGIWILSPDGFPIQIRVAEKTSPSSPPVRNFTPESNGAGRSPNKSKVHKVHPKHLSHVLIFTKSVNNSLAFYEKVLGLKMSDSAGDDLIAFVHSPHGSDHHLLAMLKSKDYGYHHSSWAVDSIDDVGFGSMQMRDAGFTEGWGVGRHVLGSNYFRYVQDPWGSFIEYSFDIDFIPHDIDWPAKNHPPDDSLYAWGPDVKHDFGHNFEVEGEMFVANRKKS
jgi:catechol 2,3-dioxygenase-like lactoylglutathione lyase family enzyme